MLEFTTRQLTITRVYDRGTWNQGALAHLSYCVTTLYALGVISMEIIYGEPWFQLALVALIIPLLAAAKGALRCMAVSDILPEWKKALGEWSWACVVLPPFVPFLVACNVLASMSTRTICWRGIRYELISSESNPHPGPLVRGSCRPIPKTGPVRKGNIPCETFYLPVFVGIVACAWGGRACFAKRTVDPTQNERGGRADRNSEPPTGVKYRLWT